HEDSVDDTQPLAISAFNSVRSRPPTPSDQSRQRRQSPPCKPRGVSPRPLAVQSSGGLDKTAELGSLAHGIQIAVSIHDVEPEPAFKPVRQELQGAQAILRLLLR